MKLPFREVRHSPVLFWFVAILNSVLLSDSSNDGKGRTCVIQLYFAVCSQLLIRDVIS